MRTAFGKYCEKLRVKNRMSQTEFSEKANMSLSRISNIECQRTNINDNVIGLYIRVLNCSGADASELRKLANFSNGLRKRSGPETTYPPLQAMLAQFGSKISPKAAAKIQQIIEKETGELVETLQFSSSHSLERNRRNRIRKRPSLTLARFAEIALHAQKVRRTICQDSEKLDVGYALQLLSVANERFDYKVVKNLPSHLEGAFACITGHSEGHTILMEENRFKNAMNGVYFLRHVICHEIAHHFLHSELLESKEEMFLAPQELSKNSCKMIGGVNPIEQVIDTIVEVEAETFASLLLIPWEEFIKGKKAEFISADYGEQPNEVIRYARNFANPSLLDAFRHILWDSDQRKHPIFSIQS